MLNLSIANGFTSDITLSHGKDFVLDTDAGVAFGYGSDIVSHSGRRFTNGLNVLFDVSRSANTAILAMRPLEHTSDDATNDPVLFRIPIPSLAAGSNTCATATGATLQALIAAGTCQAQAAGSDLCATASGSTLQSLIQAGVCPAQ